LGKISDADFIDQIVNAASATVKIAVINRDSQCTILVGPYGMDLIRSNLSGSPKGHRETREFPKARPSFRSGVFFLEKSHLHHASEDNVISPESGVVVRVIGLLGRLKLKNFYGALRRPRHVEFPTVAELFLVILKKIGVPDCLLHIFQTLPLGILGITPYGAHYILNERLSGIHDSVVSLPMTNKT
jgi:hypothetical protein